MQTMPNRGEIEETTSSTILLHNESTFTKLVNTYTSMDEHGSRKFRDHKLDLSLILEKLEDLNPPYPPYAKLTDGLNQGLNGMNLLSFIMSKAGEGHQQQQQLDRHQELLLKLIETVIRIWPYAIKEKRISFKDSLLHEAVANKYVPFDVINFLLKAWPDIIKELNLFGLTPMQTALVQNNATYDVVKLLLTSWPDTIKDKGGWGLYPLEISVRVPNVSFDIINLLVNAWPDAIMEHEYYGESSLEYAAKRPEECATFIEAVTKKMDTFGYTPLHFALKHEKMSVKIIDSILKLWPESIRAYDRNGNTPLHYILSCGNYSCEMVKLLLDSWPESVKVKNSHQQTPLHCAAFNDKISIDVLNLLIESWPEAIL